MNKVGLNKCVQCDILSGMGSNIQMRARAQQKHGFGWVAFKTAPQAQFIVLVNTDEWTHE